MQNLLEKLTKKFKENKLKMASLAMASALTMSTVSLTSCKNTNENNSNSNINNSQEYPDNSSSSSNNENSSSGNNGGGSVDYSQFSETFKNVLNSAEYNDWIYLDENTVLPDKKSLAYENPIFNALPYGFLEDEGFNIKKIKQGKLYSKADLYIKDNEDALYIELRAEIEASTNYLANYILKYPLTKQEVKEIKILFTSLGTSSKTTYHQAPFFVQELSYLKEPVVISKAYATKDALNAFENYADNKKFISSATNATFMGSTFMDDSVNFDAYNTFQIHKSLSNNYTDLPQGRMEIGQVSTYNLMATPVYIDGVIVYINTISSGFAILEEDEIKFKNSKEVVTYFSAENCYFKNIYNDKSLDKEFSK